jgi:V8-like Glu-specific endopeptidase
MVRFILFAIWPLSITFFPLLTCVSCARLQPAFSASSFDGVVGGQSVTATDPIVSSTVYLSWNNSDGEPTGACTGSLLAEDIVITAAHCINDADRDFRVGFILNNEKMKRSNSRSVIAAIANPKYKFSPNPKDPFDTDEADIGLIRISGDLPSGYRPARLLADSSNLSIESPILIAGFGITSASSVPATLRLHKKTTYVLEEHGKTELIVGRSACRGDSGGPAFVVVNNIPFLFGVFSRSDTGCSVYSVYSRIDAYQDWIDATIKKLRAKK